MKRTFMFFLTTLFITGFVSGQPMDSQTISHTPQMANGFLIMAADANPNVTKWEVAVQEQQMDAVGNIVYNTITTYTLSNTYYKRLDEQYYTDDYFVRIKGYDQNNNLVIGEGPYPIGPGPHGTYPCFWRCIGKTYAYKLKLYVEPSGGSSSVQLSSTYNDDGEPYYEYMSETQFLAGGSASDLNYYNVPSWNPYGVGVGDRIIKLTGVTDALYSATNVPLTGTVYGVQKFLGPWRGSVIESPLLTGGEGNCNQSIFWAIDMINTSSDFGSRPFVSCNGGFDNGNDGPPTTDWGETAVECWELIDIWIEDEDNDPFGALDDISDCYEDEVGSGGGIDHDFWPANAVAVTFKPYLGGGTVITVRESDFHDANGNFQSPRIEFGAGLNLMQIQFEDNSFGNIFFHSHNGYDGSLRLSDIVDVNIYEVPVPEDDFRIDFSPKGTVSCSYELYDMNGELLHQQTVDLEGMVDKTITVAPQGGIPSGQLINKFIFSDGSEITRMIIK